MKTRPLTGGRIRIGRRLHVNQPLQPYIVVMERMHRDAVKTWHQQQMVVLYKPILLRIRSP